MIVALGALVAVVVIAYIAEALRSAPATPERLPWARDLTPEYLTVDGARLRYVRTGQGPALVLLHTLRTQLDMFQKVMPALAKRFRVIAFDLPGHGYSDIPRGAYDAEFFVSRMAAALTQLEVPDAVVAGESIGGTIALLLAARHHPKVRGVVAVNPYDYGAGRGLRRSSVLANVNFGLAPIPLVGGIVDRLRSYPVVKWILAGGVVRSGALPAPLAREMYGVGNRPGYRQAFASLVAHWASWEAARTEYHSITVPTLLIYGDHDWSYPDERATTAQLIPGVELRVVQNGGHFLSLDAPEELVAAIHDWSAVATRP